MHLTKRTIADIPAPNEGYSLTVDDTLKGFYVLTYPSGKKSFVIRYTKGKSNKKFVLGDATVILPEDARKRAAALFADIRVGKYPDDQARERREAGTVGELFDRYFAEHAPRKKPKSQREDLINYNAHIKNRFATRTAREITKSDVEKMMIDLSATPYMANRVRSLLSKAFSLAEEWGIVAPNANPCQFVKKNAEAPRERLLTPQEIARLGKALDALENEIPYQARAMVGLALHTGLRVGEILRLRWEYIDTDQGVIRIPNTKHGGTSTARLTGEARKILAALPKKSEWVLPGRKKGEHYAHPQDSWNTIRKKAQLEGLHLHDLRHAFGSYAAREGANQRTIATLLNHKQLSTTEIYVNNLQTDVINAANKTSDTIAKMLNASAETEPKKPGKKKESNNGDHESIKISIKGKTPEDVTKIKAMLSLVGVEIE
jgi:integrase